MVLHGIARNAKRRRYLAISLALGRMRENIDPYPVYLHCWMITIDCIGTITFWMLLSQHLNVADIVGGAWVFVLFSCGLPVWVFMEAKSIIHDIKDETSRQIYFGGQVTPGTKASEAQARTWCCGPSPTTCSPCGHGASGPRVQPRTTPASTSPWHVITTADLSFQKRQLLDNECTEVLAASIHANLLEFMQEGGIF